MRYGSVCSGIEAATVAWHPLGWEPAFFSEIEPFPRAVLAHHYPDVPLHGDFTTIQGDDYGAIDLLVGGTPCQSFSIAGLRGGLDDDRGNLALEFLRLAERKRPKWLVWENVPGVLSSNGGRDFGSILGGMVELGYGFAYRVLDAQYFGVAQHRRRVFVVGYFGDAARAAAVLFERHSLQGHSAPRREKGKDIAGTIARSSFAGGSGGKPEGAAGNHFIPEIAGTMISRAQSGGFSNSADHAAASYIIPWPAEVAPTLNAHFGEKMGLENQHIGGGQDYSSVAKCLTARGAGGQNLDPETSTLIPMHGGEFDVVPTIYQDSEFGVQAYDQAGTLRAGRIPAHQMTVQQSTVRRLTPVECERLQGFPDNFTAIPWHKKGAEDCPDGPRYKALGNSMAVPVMRWIGERIQMVENLKC